jgi:hypothetical protein
LTQGSPLHLGFVALFVGFRRRFRLFEDVKRERKKLTLIHLIIGFIS